MNDLKRFVRRFLPPYKGWLIFSVVANTLSAVLNLLAFSLVMPILRILFRLDEAPAQWTSWSALSITDLSGSFKVVTGNFSYYIYQYMQLEGASHTLMLLAVYLVIMTGLKVLASYMGFYGLIPIRTGIVRDIRLAVYDKIVSLPISYIKGEKKGDVMARLSGDVTEIEVSIMASLDLVLKNPILIVIYLGTMIATSWQLTLFVFLVLPIAGYVMGKVGKALKRDSLTVQEQWGGLLSSIEETLTGLRIIKAFTSERYISTRFARAHEDYRQSMMRLLRRQQLAHPMSEFLGTITIAIVLWYGGTLIINGTGGISAETFIYYLVIFYSLINPLKELSKGSYAIRKGMGSMARIDAILATETDLPEPAEPKPLTEFRQAIELRGVSFRYDEQWVLRDINLTIKRGQTVALVGQSGSGKTTLAELIPRFYDPQQGQILIDGVDIRQVHSHDLRRLMGNVGQEPILFNDSVAANIAFGSDELDEAQMLRAAQVAHVDEFVRQMPEGYHSNIGDRGGKLSGGQRQRLSIARAVYKNPPILILDEATSALDTTSEHLVQEALDRLMGERTSIVIAHRLSTIVNADLICVVHEGRIVEQGTHAELLALGGRYAQSYQLQLSSSETGQ